MTREVNSPTVSVAGRVQPISRGGTGVDKASDITAKLGLLTTAGKGQANGFAGLDGGSDIPGAFFKSSGTTNKVNVDGVFTVNIGSQSIFTITDYDSFKSYSISVNVGAVVRNGDTLTYTAPNTAQTATLTINGRGININVLQLKPTTPSITTPANGATGVTASGINATASVFSVADGSSHQSSDWQIASDIAFNTIVASSIGDTINKTSWNSPSLPTIATLYMRVRYKTSNGFYSDYSSVISFTTNNTLLPTTEEAILSASDKVVSAQFGNSVAMSSDGSRVVVGAYAFTGTQTNQGKVYIFLRNGNTWTQEAAIVAADPNVTAQFGISVSISGDGSRIAVGANNFTGTQTNQGKVYIFSRSGVTWTLEAGLVANDPVGSAGFGFSVSMSSDGSRIVTGANGIVKSYIFLRTGTAWAQEAAFVASDSVSNNGFGQFVSMSADGLRVAVAAHRFTGTLSQQGKVYIFLRTGTAWAQEAAFVASDPVASAAFGGSVSMSSDGSRVVVGANGFTGTLSDQGKIYVFSRTGTTWAQEAAILPSDPTASAQFGWVVSISADGSRVVVGANTFSNAYATQGKAYVFGRSGTTWSQSGTMTASNAANNQQFGYSVSLSADGSRIAIGGTRVTVGGTAAAGAAYIYH